MKRIRLSRNEKRLLRNIALRADYWPDGMSKAALAACAGSLSDAGFIRAAFSSGHELYAAELTHKGAMYLQENPHLHNPTDWSRVAAIAAVVGTIAAIAGLLIACTKLL